MRGASWDWFWGKFQQAATKNLQNFVSDSLKPKNLTFDFYMFLSQLSCEMCLKLETETTACRFWAQTVKRDHRGPGSQSLHV